MDKIVFVVGDRHNPNAHHFKLTGTVTVGRSYHCDVVLGDSFIEPVQMIFHLGGNQRTVEVMPGNNPVYRNGVIALPGSYEFVSGDEWSCGKSRLSAFEEHHAVTPTEKMLVGDFRGGALAQAGILLTSIVVLVSWIGLHDWLGSFNPPEFDKDIARILSSGYILFVIFWSVLWGIVGRFSSGRNQFNVHLTMAVAFVVADMAVDDFTAYAAYITNRDTVWLAVDFICSTGLVALLLTGCFSYALHVRGMKYIALGFALSLQVLEQLDNIAERSALAPNFNTSVKPPFTLLLPPSTVEEFMQEADSVFADARQEAASSGK